MKNFSIKGRLVKTIVKQLIYVFRKKNYNEFIIISYGKLILKRSHLATKLIKTNKKIYCERFYGERGVTKTLKRKRVDQHLDKDI